MADCTDPKEQQLSGAFPGSQGQNVGGLQVNLSEDALSIFNPNLALASAQTYNTLNSVANQMFGIDARWFRAVPQQRSKDVIFQEYTLSCVEDTPICLKVVVGPNGFPDSKYQMDLMGLQYELPTQIEIDKKYWETTVGFGTAPQKKDIVYLPLPNKLYQVESSFLKRGFMEQETTWVVNLRKYQPEASRREGEALKETIDKYTVGEQELFGEAIQDNIEKLTDKKQTSAFNSTSQDIYKTLDSSLRTVNYNLEIHGVIVAQSLYEMKSSAFFNAVRYNASDHITTTSDRALTSWVMPKNFSAKEYDVESINPNIGINYPANYIIKLSPSPRSFNEGDTFVISRPGALNFYAKIIYVGVGEYYCKIDEDVEKYLISLTSGWRTMKNYKVRVQEPINLIDGINETNYGFKASIIANQYIKILYGSQEKVIPINTRLLDNSWYGIVINLGNTWGQYNAYVWKPNTTGSGDKLTKVFYNTVSLNPEEVIINQYILDRSDSLMTNIRLFKTTIEEEKQSLELLSYFSKDADQAILLDNCDLKYTAPYISRQR